MTDPRRTNRWKTMAAEILRTATHCEVCGAAIDKTARPRSPWAGSVDHVMPVEHYPELAFDRTNLRPVHVRCNSQLGRAQQTARRNGARHRPTVTAGAGCPVHGTRLHPECHGRRWILGGCDRHGDQCPDLAAP